MTHFDVQATTFEPPCGGSKGGPGPRTRPGLRRDKHFLKKLDTKQTPTPKGRETALIRTAALRGLWRAKPQNPNPKLVPKASGRFYGFFF